MGRIREMVHTIDLPIYPGTGYLDLVYPYGDGPWTNPSNYSLGTGTAYSYHKMCMDELHPGPPFKTGGPLNVWEYWSDEWTPKGSVDVMYSLWRYVGKHVPTMMPSGFLDWTDIDEFKASDAWNPDSYGPQAWNRFRPTRSGAEIGVFLGEFRDFPRMLRGTAKGFHDIWRAMGGSLTGFAPRSVANHWLNTQFGWSPFLNDLRRFYKVTKSLDARLKRLRKLNGRWIRRGGTVATEESEETVLDDQNTPGLFPVPQATLFSSPLGWRKATRSLTKNVWFKGAFRFWIPGDPNSWYWKARAIQQLYGLYPSPSVIWEITPWSWLIDWWSSVGDSFANISSTMFDNLAAKYAYVMGTTVQNVKFTGCNNYKNTPVTCTWNASFTRKSRVAASPFGFGLAGADFSARQWSILGALGLTRLGR